MQLLSDIDALIIDMDGVLWEGSRPLPGLQTFFSTLRQQTIPFILATNNATLTQSQYVKKLQSMGVTVFDDEILTSSMATTHYLAQQCNPQETRIFIIGEAGLQTPLLAEGFQLLEMTEQPIEMPADYVVCGLDRELSWRKLAEASVHLNQGAQLIATNADTTLPTERGNLPGNGAILASLKASTQVLPKVIGKPQPIMYQQAIEKLGSTAATTVAIGDRLDTDILGAVKANIRSIMVLTGISNRQDLASIDYQPTWIMPDIEAVSEALKNRR